MSCCPTNYLGLTQLGRPINLILRHAAPQGANAGFVIASQSSGLTRTAATPATTASAAAATAPAVAGACNGSPSKYRGLLARFCPPSPRSDMLQSSRTGIESPRTGSVVTPLNPSNHLCFRTCSHYSPSLFSGLWEGRSPAVQKCYQIRDRFSPSGSS